ncbi:DsbC family protein [Candidatus Thiosymbion oneisti]|uniref:DsbC family protein n=1 Tax=Candidatus Thiosymbion oneisti TaxID=589554 RepID=UPI000A5DF752|nr:DsbC family protein [Candidatus Thiosymbion oneisti]
MWNHRIAFFAGVILTLAASPLLADADAKIKARLGKVLSPGYEIGGIKETPIKGLFEVVVGADVIYVSGDGKYMVDGRLIDLASQKDLTEPRRAMIRKQAVDQVGEDRMVIFAPDEYEHTITVFTDIDCGYCRKLHREIADYGAEGIRVRYLFFPRAGVDSDSFKKSVSVWCADDRRQAMTDAKAGKPVETKSCENPVQDHLELGKQVGVSGTPAILLESGDMVRGYVPAKRLAAMLNAKEG